jgi:long-chain acyl-CoA synthetase
MGVIDEDGYLFIKGRSKCMILGPSGQNIYPEELEAVVNTITYVVDSLVIEDDGITALIYPDYHEAEIDGLTRADLEARINSAIPEVNKQIPNYSKITKVVLMPEDFERTPKRSIKRYLYQRSGK